MTAKKTTYDLRTWQQIADYANADLTDNAKALKAAEHLIRGLDERMSFVDLVGKPVKGESLEQRFSRQAVWHQPTVRGLLNWLCQPTPDKVIPTWEGVDIPPMMISPVDALYAELSDERLTQQFDPQFDEDSEDYYPFYFVREVGFHSILGPLCKFIVDELEDSGEIAPVRLCERVGCGKFMVSERRGRKRFCSDQCRALSFQRSREDWTEYMRRYRKLKAQRKFRRRSK